MKKLTCFVLIFLLFNMSFGTIVAADYSQAFIEVFVDDYPSAKSPLRIGLSDYYPIVISKCNQPRSVGSNPHRGTDLQASAGTSVYSIFGGTVSFIDRSSVSIQEGSVIVNCDINGDGTPDDKYIKYMHIVPSYSISVGSSVSSNTIVGEVDSNKGYYTPHLHFERCFADGTIKYKLFNFYRWVSTWNYGSDLDFISGNSFIGNDLYITGYSCTEAGAQKYNLSSFKLYYKIGSGGVWQSTPIDLSVYNSSIYRWTINLKNATGASTGQSVYYYLVGIRAYDPSFYGSYRHGIWPQHYKQPDYPLPSQYTWITTSHTIQ